MENALKILKEASTDKLELKIQEQNILQKGSFYLLWKFKVT